MIPESGLFSSWVTPEISWPMADIFSACISCSWAPRSLSWAFLTS